MDAIGGASAPVAAPGWYPDPFGNPDVVRWFDGRAWQAEAARRQAPTERKFPAEYRVTYRPPNHGFHLAMTVLTCGLWAPVWMAGAGGRYTIRKGGKKR